MTVKKATAKTSAAKAASKKRSTTGAVRRKGATAVRAKAASKKAGVKKKAAKKAGAKRKPNAAFMKAMTPDAALAAIVGRAPLPRTEVTKKIWDYIKKNKLQDAIDRRMINADEKLAAVFGKQDKKKGNDPGPSVSMFEMTKLISKRLK